MAREQDERDEVRRNYVNKRMKLPQAADEAGVPLGTARRWKTLAETNGDDWDRARSAASLTSAGAGAIAQIVLGDFLTLHQATVEGIMEDKKISALDRAEALSRLADAFTKTMAAVAKAAPELGRYAVATELLGDLAKFVQGRFPQYTAPFAEILEPFAADVAQRYG